MRDWLAAMRLLIVVLLVATLAAPAAGAAPEGSRPAVRHCSQVMTDEGRSRAVCIHQANYFRDVCRAISIYAKAWRLPEGFFARLIWQESRFDPNAISIAGAEGIAQFIPSTAKLRGLGNSFNPAEALARSAEYLRFLADKFGSLGLAAAAYNSGEGRIERYVRTAGYLPLETEDYVAIITGASAATWLEAPPAEVDYALSKSQTFETACVEMARTAPMPRLDVPPGEWHPFGVLIAQDFSPAVARRMFERVKSGHPEVLGEEELMMLTGRNRSFGTRLRHFAMVGRDSRDEAIALCRRLTAEGGICTVKEN
jgi:hypothetical protein